MKGNLKSTEFDFDDLEELDFGEKPGVLPADSAVNGQLEALTLDEPIMTTLLRDLRSIGLKTRHVLLPVKTEYSKTDDLDALETDVDIGKTAEETAKSNREALLIELRNWDLWGPLLFCMILAISLSWNARSQADLTFSVVFYLFWLGSGVVTLNAQLLKGEMTFFQSLSALGYSLFPLVLGSVIVTLFLSFDVDDKESPKTKRAMEVGRFIVVFCTCGWSIKAATVFMNEFIGQKRKLLAVYPVILLYLATSGLILTI